MGRVVGCLILVLALLSLGSWLHHASSLTGKLIFCDVGQADATLITYQTTQILIDVGRNESVIDCLHRYMPPFDTQIEFVVITHADFDHYGGYSHLLGDFEVLNLMMSPFNKETADFEQFKQLVQTNESSTKTVLPSLGQRISFCPFCTAWVLISSEEESLYQVIQNRSAESILSDKQDQVEQNLQDNNDRSIVLIVEIGNHRIGLFGDREIPGILSLIRLGLIGTMKVLKVPHHGSKGGLSETFLRLTQPEYAVVSAGKNNSYHHPANETIQLLYHSNSQLLRTDYHGDVVFGFNQTQLWLLDDSSKE